MEQYRAGFLLASASIAFLGSTLGMALRVEPFATWYYSFAWWSYIVGASAWLAIRRREPILGSSRVSLRTLVLSIAIWASFEVYNFRLGNWHYVDLPSARMVRWAGYAVAYATVLPGLFVTWRLLESSLPERSPTSRQLPESLPKHLLWIGFAGSLAPWIWPRTFFPWVWLGPTALFAAINYRLGGSGILSEIERRGLPALLRLMGAGGICGLLWELWNFWARSKWVYSIPYLDWLPFFEMPLAGFLGFFPFAVECHEMYWVAIKGLERLRESSRLLETAAWLAVVVYIAAVFWGIDRFTVSTFWESS